MKKGILFLILLFLLQLQSIHAQTGVNISYIAPTGNLKYILKPTFGIELTQAFINDIEDDRLHLFGSIGLFKPSPTQDTFHTVTYTNDPSRAAIIPSVQVINSFIVMPIGIGGEYKFLDAELSPLFGLDAYFFVIFYEGYKRTPGLISSTSSQNLWQTGLMPKIGVTYNLNEEWLVSAGIGRNVGLKGTSDPLDYWKTYVRILRIL